jgi:Pyridoxamine 5'-phosphate oxidase
VTTASQHDETPAGRASGLAASQEAATGPEGAASRLTTEQVWRALAGASFAVVSYVTPDGKPRSSGVVYATAGRRLYVAVAADSWKARHIAGTGRVAVTVPVRRGGLLSLLFPIPPACVSFHGAAIVHPPGPLAGRPVPKQLAALVPAERQASSCILEIVPEGQFVTYGLGVSLMQMRSPAAARARVPAK